MKISLEWLNDFIDLDLSPARMMDALEEIGLSIEGWEDTDHGVILDAVPQFNRPDLMGHLGIARELAAKLDLPLKENDWSALEGEDPTAEAVAVQVWEEKLCPRYSGVVIREIAPGPSEEWLQARLRSMGLKPINNAVDAANYVLFATGHPLHVFDLDRIAGEKIIVRKAKKAETMTSLDGRELTFDGDELIIADDRAPLALAGIAGGRTSAVSEETSDIFIESAVFDPASIFKTSQKFRLSTEASQRFVKGVDVSFTPQAVRMAASLICRSGGRTTRGLLDIYPAPPPERTLVFRRRRIEELLGTEVADEYVETLFKRLGLQVEKQQPDSWRIRVPLNRMDIAKETDLVEEIGRFYGYEQIPSRIHPIAIYPPQTDPLAEKKENLRQILFHHGLDEVVNSGLVEGEMQSHFGCTGRSPVSLENAIFSKRWELRTSLLTELMGTLARNINREREGVHIFEMGHIHFLEDEKREERLSLGLASSGLIGYPHWRDKPRQTDIFYIKGISESLLSQLGYGAFSFVRGERNGCQRDTCLLLRYKGQQVGYLGGVSRAVCDYFSIKEPVWVAELDLSRLFEKQPQRFKMNLKTRFPSVSRDVSFVGGRDVLYQDIRDTIGRMKVPCLESFALVDRFIGKPVPEDKVSLSFRFVFRHPKKTLLAEEVDEFLKTIIDGLRAAHNFMPREGG
jgi:phenylalanyl-tRNA synthetase beta chain